MESQNVEHIVEAVDLAASAHAKLRMKQRGIPREAIDTALLYGRMHFQKGAVHFLIGTKEIERHRRHAPRIERYNGIRVVCASDSGTIITAYRNPNFSNIRR